MDIVRNTSRKQKTIEACKRQVDKYLNPKGKIFFSMLHCGLCHIHAHQPNATVTPLCHGCPLAATDGHPGCTSFKSYQRASDSVKLVEARSGVLIESSEEFVKRSQFFERIIPILEDTPSEHFTTDGWKFFKRIKSTW